MFLVIMCVLFITLSVIIDRFQDKRDKKSETITNISAIAGLVCILTTVIVVAITIIKPPFNNDGGTAIYPVCDYSVTARNYSISYKNGDAFIMCVSDSVVPDENIDKPIVVITKPGTIDDSYKFFFPWLSLIEIERIEEVLHIPAKED